MRTIGTHDGRFHCDEILAIFLLKQLPEFKDARIIRTRDLVELEKCDAVVDVGRVYDPDNMRFDHHQKDFCLTWEKFFNGGTWDVKLSSAGLVYVHFGKLVLSLMTGWDINSEKLNYIFKKIYGSFIVEIDGIDNGISPCSNKHPYNIQTGISSRVERFNPWWNSTKTDENCEMIAFNKAYNLVTEEFTGTVNYYKECWWPARQIVSKAFQQRKDIDPSRSILVLDSSCPWQIHLSDLEHEEQSRQVVYPVSIRHESYRPTPKVPPKVLFTVYPRDDGMWWVQAVPTDKFRYRLKLPDKWCSLTDSELCDVTGIPGCLFVHGTGYLGLHETRDGAIEMARLAIHMFNMQEAAENKRMKVPPTFTRGRGSRYLR